MDLHVKVCTCTNILYFYVCVDMYFVFMCVHKFQVTNIRDSHAFLLYRSVTHGTTTEPPIFMELTEQRASLSQSTCSLNKLFDNKLPKELMLAAKKAALAKIGGRATHTTDFYVLCIRCPTMFACFCLFLRV